MERWLAAVAFGMVLGCGANGTVDLDLVHAPFDDPYRGLDRLHAQVLDSNGNVVVAHDFDPFGPSLAIDGLGVGNGRVVRIEGYAGTELRSRGESAPLDFADGNHRAPIAFSTLPVAVVLPVAAFAPGGINVDGAIDEWAAAPVAAELHPSNASLGMPSSDTDLSAKIYLAWDDKALYVAVRVRDNCVVCDTAHPDKVIVSWDGQDDREMGTYGPDDGNATGGVTVIDTTGAVKAAAAKIAGGYAVEFRIGNDAMGGTTLAPGRRVGFEVELFDGVDGMYKSVEAWVPSPDPLNRRPYPSEMGTIGIVQYP